MFKTHIKTLSHFLALSGTFSDPAVAFKCQLESGSTGLVIEHTVRAEGRTLATEQLCCRFQDYTVPLDFAILHLNTKSSKNIQRRLQFFKMNADFSSVSAKAFVSAHPS